MIKYPQACHFFRLLYFGLADHYWGAALRIPSWCQCTVILLQGRACHSGWEENSWWARLRAACLFSYFLSSRGNRQFLIRTIALSLCSSLESRRGLIMEQGRATSVCGSGRKCPMFSFPCLPFLLVQPGKRPQHSREGFNIEKKPYQNKDLSIRASFHYSVEPLLANNPFRD